MSPCDDEIFRILSMYRNLSKWTLINTFSFPEFPNVYLFAHVMAQSPIIKVMAYEPLGFGEDLFRARFIDGPTPNRRYFVIPTHIVDQVVEIILACMWRHGLREKEENI